MVTPASSALATLLLGKTRSAVLQVLLGRPGEEFHLRHIVRLSGSGVGPVQRELKTLAGVGILQRRHVGRQVLYTANSMHPLYPDLRSLILKTAGAAGLIADALRPLAPQIRVAFLFGSVARGQEQAASDIDLMIVGTPTFTAVAALLSRPQQIFGRDINPTIYPPREFARKAVAGHHFISSVLDSPKTFLLGDQNELLRLAEKRLAPAPPDEPRRNRKPPRRHRKRPHGQ